MPVKCFVKAFSISRAPNFKLSSTTLRKINGSLSISRAIHEGDDYPMLMSLHLSIASRILLKYSNLFNEFVHQLAVEIESTPDKVAGMLFSITKLFSL